MYNHLKAEVYIHMHERTSNLFVLLFDTDIQLNISYFSSGRIVKISIFTKWQNNEDHVTHNPSKYTQTFVILIFYYIIQVRYNFFHQW